MPAVSSGKSENSKFKPSLPGPYGEIIVKVGRQNKFYIMLVTNALFLNI